MSDLKYWHDTWKDELVHSKQLQLELGQAKAEIDRLRAIERDRDAVCNSYAAENQRFSDKIDRLRAELVRLEWVEKFSKDTVADNDRLRAELEVLKSAEANKDWLALVADNKRLRAELAELKKWRQAYEETWNAERDCLRAENAESLKVVKKAAYAGCWDEANKTLWEYLAKTAKEGT